MTDAVTTTAAVTEAVATVTEAVATVTEAVTTTVATITNVTNVTYPAERVRQGITFDKFPLRLDIPTEYQDWVLVGVSILLVILWCLPCLCGKLRNSCARKFTQYIYTRLNIFFWTMTYVNLAVLMMTIITLPDWTMNEYMHYLVLFVTWVLIHLKKMIISAAIIGGFFFITRFQEKIRIAAGLEHITVIHFNWKEWLGFSQKKRPVELFVWKVEDLQGSSGKVYKANDIFCECHLGDNEPTRTRVHNNAGTSCIVKESFQMNINENDTGCLMTLFVKDQTLVMSTELARLTLATREVLSIEDQTGKRKVDFTYSEDSFICLSLLPHGKIWLAIAPVEDMDEERAPLIREDALVNC